jgi:hypothetical protein
MGFMQRLQEKIENLASSGLKKLEPSQFNHPLAEETQWTSLSTSASNFRTHKLVTVHSDRLEFKSTGGNLAFSLIFLLFGILVPIIVVISSLDDQSQFEFDTMMFIPLGIGLVFTILGVVLLRSALKPIVIDRQRGYFWKGRQAPHQVMNPESIKTAVPISEIGALQLISKRVSGSKGGSYTAYELNIVKKNGDRANIVCHGSGKKLRPESALVAEFLNCPLWDAS